MLGQVITARILRVKIRVRVTVKVECQQSKEIKACMKGYLDCEPGLKALLLLHVVVGGNLDFHVRGTALLFPCTQTVAWSHIAVLCWVQGQVSRALQVGVERNPGLGSEDAWKIFS